MDMLRKKSNGFTLIEVLVSLVILSIGILGLGVLQISSLKNTQGGYMRSQAIIHGYSIFDSMRANIPAVTAQDYDIGFLFQLLEVASCYGLAADCTTTQMARADLNRWRTTLTDQLPNGAGQIISTDLGDTTRVEVTIRWIDPYSADAGAEQLVLVSELRR